MSDVINRVGLKIDRLSGRVHARVHDALRPPGMSSDLWDATQRSHMNMGAMLSDAAIPMAAQLTYHDTACSTCNHEAAAHVHFRRGEDCGQCPCSQFVLKT